MIIEEKWLVGRLLMLPVSRIIPVSLISGGELAER
jgi:hypothetical protein